MKKKERIIKVKRENNRTEELGIIVEDYSYIEILVDWKTEEITVVGEKK